MHNDAWVTISVLPLNIRIATRPYLPTTKYIYSLLCLETLDEATFTFPLYVYLSLIPAFFAVILPCTNIVAS